MIKRLTILLNTVIVGLVGYVYGFYEGSNQPTIDKNAINHAVYMAMMEK